MRLAHLLFLLLASAAFAGWNDLSLTSPQQGQGFRQGDNITLTMRVSNDGVTDGGAVYIFNATLTPNPCIANGTPLISEGAFILCPSSAIDLGCPNRFRGASTSYDFTFENLPTNEACENGEYSYAFTISGNSEAGASGSFSPEKRSANASFTLRFTGPYFCGDGTCTVWKNESCASCPQDCGRCAECESGAKSCLNDSVATCIDGFWQVTEECEAGCHIPKSEPECVTPCESGTRTCTAIDTLSVCENKRWRNITCEHGCLLDACKGSCETEGCPESCENSVHSFNGACDPITGNCNYQTETCELGCDGTACAVAPTSAEGGKLCPLGLVLAVLGTGVLLLARLHPQLE